METDGSNKSFLGNGLIIVLLKNTTQQMHIKMTWEKFGDIILMFLSIDRIQISGDSDSVHALHEHFKPWRKCAVVHCSCLCKENCNLFLKGATVFK